MASVEEVKKLLYEETDDPLSYFANYICPELEGHEDLKMATLMMLVNKRDAIKGKRDRIHILLVGEPGTGKTELLKWLELHFNAEYFSGEDISASTLKGDARRKDYGARILQRVAETSGILCIDEMDLFPNKDALRTAMEHGFIKMAKGGRELQYPCQIRVVAAANELKGFSKAIQDRFDLEFHFDEPTPKESKKIASKIIDSRAGEIQEDIEFLRNFITVAQGIRPHITNPDAIKRVFDHYFEIVQKGRTGRWIDSVMRLATAIAKIHLDDLEPKYVVRALNFKDKSLTNAEINELLEVAES